MEKRNLTPDEKKRYDHFVEKSRVRDGATEHDVDPALYAAFMEEKDTSPDDQIQAKARDYQIQAKARTLIQRFKNTSVPMSSFKTQMKRPFPASNPASKLEVVKVARRNSTTGTLSTQTSSLLYTDPHAHGTKVPVRLTIDLSSLASFPLRTPQGSAISTSASKQFSVKLVGFLMSDSFCKDEFLGAFASYLDDELEIRIHMPTVVNHLLATTDTNFVHHAANLSKLLTIVDDSQTPHLLKEVCAHLLKSTRKCGLEERELSLSYGLHKNDTTSAAGAVEYPTMETLGDDLLLQTTKQTPRKRYFVVKLSWQLGNTGRLNDLYEPSSEAPVIENSDGDQHQELPEAEIQERDDECVVEVFDDSDRADSHDDSDDDKDSLDEEWNYNLNNNNNNDPHSLQASSAPLPSPSPTTTSTLPLKAASVTSSKVTSTDNWSAGRRRSVDRMQANLTGSEANLTGSSREAASSQVPAQLTSTAVDPRCIVCYGWNASVLTVPCGHYVFCADCVTNGGGEEKCCRDLLHATCPLCRGFVSQVIRTYR